MKKVYSNSDAIAYWLIAGYFTVVGTIALIVS
ncbi:hypothetical protein CLV24_11287 [Pontibacter ummariensis]|uniref:Uncharacterized protein n=1 Tax=Pontibacter ummariensis TaxID=1610492 RepID=A0A239GYV9_9BACT|nr:hypothetical protein CLV24_11287 [Pontibacter ummariensis]SNS74320.1 hypothetical protein SAMN06296052_11291 [Pontibacter ummariensis]